MLKLLMAAFGWSRLYAIPPGYENPQQPMAVSETFVPDQLIAGRFPLVTMQNVTLTGGAALNRGSVLGQVTVGTPPATGTAVGGNTGNGTITAVAAGSKTQVGTYTIKFTGATTYNVFDPNGRMLEPGAAAGAYPAGAGAAQETDLSFTFTAGGTAMVAGDGFTITVPAGSGKFKLAASNAVDGSQIPSAILGDYTDATGGDVNCAIYASGEFNSNFLTFGSGITASSAAAVLRDAGIYLRSVLPATGTITNF
jgi:hypothetical protein